MPKKKFRKNATKKMEPKAVKRATDEKKSLLGQVNWLKGRLKKTQKALYLLIGQRADLRKEVARLKEELRDQGERIAAQVKENTALRKEVEMWAECTMQLAEFFAALYTEKSLGGLILAMARKTADNQMALVMQQLIRVKELEAELATEKAAHEETKKQLELALNPLD